MDRFVSREIPAVRPALNAAEGKYVPRCTREERAAAYGTQECTKACHHAGVRQRVAAGERVAMKNCSVLLLSALNEEQLVKFKIVRQRSGKNLCSTFCAQYACVALVLCAVSLDNSRALCTWFS